MTPPTANAHPPRLACQRTQAAMLSVALALSTTLPAGAAFAHEPDQEHEGTTPPEATLPDTATDPDYDPSSEETDLPFDVGTPRDGGDDDTDHGAPVDVEPIQDLDAPAIPLDAPTTPAPGPVDGSDEPVAPAEPAPPTPQPAPAPGLAPPPAAANPQPDPNRSAADRSSDEKAEKTPARSWARNRDGERPTVRVTLPAPAPVVAPPPAPVALATEPVEAAPPVTADDPARPGKRSHTVQRGESLWVIARTLIGSGATNADIATEVHRIYELNRHRIGSDPNVLIAGTVLRLR